MPVHAHAGGLGQPRFEILKKFRKTLKHRIGSGGYPVFMIPHGKPALHVQSGPPARAPFDSLCKHAVDLTRVWLCPLLVFAGLAQKCVI